MDSITVPRAVQDENCGDKVVATESLLFIACIETGAVEILLRDSLLKTKVYVKAGNKRSIPKMNVAEDVGFIEHLTQNVTQTYIFWT